MKFNYTNNHIVIPVYTSKGVKNAILDTGNPAFTIFKDNSIKEISLSGINFNLQSNVFSEIIQTIMNWDEISKLVKTEIDGIIGYDFLLEHDLLIDLKNFDISIAENIQPFDSNVVEMNFFMNVPIIKLKIQGLEINAIFDTGAMHTVINSNYREYLFDKNEIIEDYNPTLGKFIANLYEGDIIIGNILIENSIIACST
ncbi:MAG: hypothetical protein QXV73_05555, partial [Candidatus Micrarchaeia archaeon]